MTVLALGAVVLEFWWASAEKAPKKAVAPLVGVELPVCVGGAVPPVKPWLGPLWRPLLSWRKAAIRDWMEARNFSWREDGTNGQRIAVRNRVRNEVMPLLNEVFSRDVVPVITRAQPDDLAPQLQELLQLIDLKDPQGRLFLPKLSPLSEPLQSRILFDYLKEEGIQELSTEKLQECLQLINTVDTAKVNLPGGHYLRRKEQRVFVELGRP